MRKGQASVEFLVVIAIMGVAMLPLLLAVDTNAQTMPEKLAMGKAQFSVARLGATVDSVGSLGAQSQMRTALELPALVGINATGKEISARVLTSYGPVDIVQATHFNVTSTDLSSIHQEGSYMVLVSASKNLSDQNVTITLGQSS